jgi:hypothetical protein
MRIRRLTAATVCAGLIATGCGGSSSTNTSAPAASLKPLPATGCSLLSSAEVSSFLGTVPKCETLRSDTPKQDLVAAVWPATHGDQSVKAGVSRTNVAEDKETFEGEAGAKSNGAARAVGGLGDDAVLVADPNSSTSGSIWVLHGNDVIVVTVTHGKLTGNALAKALTAAGRRLVASY